MKPVFLAIVAGLVLLSACQTSKTVSEVPPYAPIDQALYTTILEMDSIFFHAYNTCDMETQAALYADEVEFYHDKGGLSTSKADILKGTKENICGKVTRTLLKETAEVYPINNYGAVLVGYHTFFNNQEPDAPSIPSKFVVIWQLTNDQWKITKVISLHAS